jgi:hypothetical protein
MDLRAAKELVHIRGWLDGVAVIVGQGRDAYLNDFILQEAGDSLMMKLGEAANLRRWWSLTIHEGRSASRPAR